MRAYLSHENLNLLVPRVIARAKKGESLATTDGAKGEDREKNMTPLTSRAYLRGAQAVKPS